jgi:N-acetylneuraminate synthase/N,N'-diacetyllegionaminate synthase
VNVLVLIAARSGSKGLPGKNLRSVAGISLVGRAVRVGRRFLRASGLRGTVLIDTDSQAIADEAARWGAEAPFLRPAELALDTTPIVDSVLHAADRLAAQGREHDVIVLLQPTSPLRSVQDVAACFAAYDPAVGSALAVTAPDHAPAQALRSKADGTLHWRWPELEPGARRQELEALWRPSGAVYVSSVASLRANRTFLVPGRTRGVALPAERSVDVDHARDLALAEALAQATPVRELRIGARRLGPGEPCFVIAEAGVNHNGQVELAHRLIDLAADCGADAVKFQTFDPDLLVSPAAAMADYQVANTGRRRSQREMLQELVLPRSAHEELMRHARDRGLEFLSSPFDEASADFLAELGVPAIKLGSGELTNHPLLGHVAGKGLPLLVSTGMADMPEVDAALEVIAERGDPQVALLHCVTSYPAEPVDANLQAMVTLQSAFGLPVGFSDHTAGIAVALGAAALGATVIEKHFTLDRGLPGPDHKASLTAPELLALVRGIREVEAARGDGVKRPRPVELPLRVAARRSLHAARDLPAGHVLVASDLVALRPGDGFAPSRLTGLLGSRLRRAISAGEQLREGHLA